jgi:hypothetical protein
MVLLTLTGAADARPRECYTATEFEAEQGLRIHSELMVIGLTCMKMPHGQSLYGKYQDFSLKNAGLISEYESDMIGYYRKSGVKNPEMSLHTLRTNLANEISQHAISMSTLSFCQQFSPRIDKALGMDQTKIRRWAQHVWAKQPTIKPLCSRTK